MSELPDRAGRALGDHASLAAREDGTWEATTTPFDATVVPEPSDGSEVVYRVVVRVPTLDAVTTDDVAPVVEEGWYETFELRVVDVGGVTRGTHEDPTVGREAETVTVEATVSDSDAGRAADDAVAIVDFVEGTYVQGVIPGYDYTDPVQSLLDRARQTGGTG
jgi:hypothetical protein